MTNSLKHWLASARKRLEQAGSDSARTDAEVLASFVLQRNRAWLYAFDDYLLTPQEHGQLEQWLTQREQGHPIAYLVGEREFWSLRLNTNSSTLIPRPDTETLVEWALELPLLANAEVLDLGTGTGAIALALASEQPSWQVQGVDFNPKAVHLSQANAQLNRLNRVRFYPSNWFEKVQGRFDLIVSNPPYIDEQDPHLSQGDVRFEPLTALVAKQQGLSDLIHIIDQAPNYLKNQGWLLLEHGYQQAEQVQHLLLAKGYSQVATRHDLSGNPRITSGQWLAPQFC